MEFVTRLRWRSATPVLTPRDRPVVPAANFLIILCELSCPVVGLPL